VRHSHPRASRVNQGDRGSLLPLSGSVSAVSRVTLRRCGHGHLGSRPGVAIGDGVHQPREPEVGDDWTQMRVMRGWHREHGRPVRQRRCRQSRPSTSAKAGGAGRPPHRDMRVATRRFGHDASCLPVFLRRGVGPVCRPTTEPIVLPKRGVPTKLRYAQPYRHSGSSGRVHVVLRRAEQSAGRTATRGSDDAPGPGATHRRLRVWPFKCVDPTSRWRSAWVPLLGKATHACFGAPDEPIEPLTHAEPGCS